MTDDELFRATVLLAAAAANAAPDDVAVKVALDALPHAVKDQIATITTDGTMADDFATAMSEAQLLIENVGCEPLDTLAGRLTQLSNIIAGLKGNQVVSCVYCGYDYPEGTPRTKHELLSAHIKECEMHPVRWLRLMLIEVQWSSLVGETDRGCPICLQMEEQGHADQCRLGLLLKPDA